MAADGEHLMTPAEVAARLRVSRRTVRRMIDRHELRAVRISASWRVPSSEVERLATPAQMPAAPMGGPTNQYGRPVGEPTPPLGDGPSVRIFRRRSWESVGADAAPATRAGAKREAARG